ncbi:MAG: hypothetical protein N3A61_06835 [Ignavibacteria bacterium]|nr:hypothetical protein [Ignavibacteria bacterium]
MDFIELKVEDDISKLKNLVEQNTYSVKAVKIIYNPLKYSLRDLDELQSFIEKYFNDVPIEFQESDSNQNISFILGIE